MPAFLLCCPPQALRPQDGPGCASPADGDPCRTRTCVRCVRGSRPTAGRTGRELERKVEVSNPHGRAVSLFSKQGAPSQRGIPSRAEGQRIERWRGCPRPSLSKRAPFLSVNPPMQVGTKSSSDSDPARFERASSGVGDRCASSRATGAWDRNRSRATTRIRSGDLSRTRAALFPLSYGGVASSTGLEPVASAFGRQRSCPSELRRDGTPARTRTRNWRFVVSCDHPFHHQGLAPQTGFDPVASALTGRRSPD
jgi:hypothetical protein